MKVASGCVSRSVTYATTPIATGLTTMSVDERVVAHVRRCSGLHIAQAGLISGHPCSKENSSAVQVVMMSPYQHRDGGDVTRAPGGSMKTDIACDAAHERDRLVPDVDADRAMATEHPISDFATQGTFGYTLRIKPDRRVGGGSHLGIERRQLL